MDQNDNNDNQEVFLDWSNSMCYKISEGFVLVLENQLSGTIKAIMTTEDYEEISVQTSLANKTLEELENLRSIGTNRNSEVWVSPQDQRKIQAARSEKLATGTVSSRNSVILNYNRKVFKPKKGLKFVVPFIIHGTKIKIEKAFKINTSEMEVNLKNGERAFVDIDYTLKVTNPQIYASSRNIMSHEAIKSDIGQRLDSAIRAYFSGFKSSELTGIAQRDFRDLYFMNYRYKSDVSEIYNLYGISIDRIHVSDLKLPSITESIEKQQQAQIDNQTKLNTAKTNAEIEKIKLDVTNKNIINLVSGLKATGYSNDQILNFLMAKFSKNFLYSNGDSNLRLEMLLQSLLNSSNNPVNNQNSSSPLTDEKFEDYKRVELCDEDGWLNPDKASEIFQMRGLDLTEALNVRTLTEQELEKMDELVSSLSIII